MTDIFLSYASEDRGRVKPLVDYLKSLGWSVWWDRDLIAGPSFDEKIDEAIGAASCVVVAWSQASIASKWVRAEANEGLEREILVPLLLEDVRPPLVFRTSHAANLIGWPERRPETELNALVAGIRDVVGPAPEREEVIDAVISSQSIAVLRFVDMSPGQDQGPLCAGIAEEILNKLTQIRDLKVIARTSSFQFDPSTADVREIGNRLSVHHVLEGSVRTADNQVRITAQLIECAGESHRWSESYTRELVDLFSLYDEVADAIAQELDIVISGGRRTSAGPPTQSEEALRLVMQARFKAEETGNPKASFPLVNRAIALDPDYADAHCLQGLLYFALGDSGYELSEPSFVSAQRCFKRALSLDPNLPEAYFRIGLIQSHLELDFGLVAESWSQADRLRGYPIKYSLLARAGYYQQAERDCRQNVDRDPFGIEHRYWLGRILARLGRIEEATRAYEEGLELAPRHIPTFQIFLQHLVDFAHDAGAAEQLVQETQCSGGVRRWAQAEIARERGDSGPLRSLVEAWVARRETHFIRAWTIERSYYDLGDYGEHIRWFEVREREKDNLSFVPIFTLRDHPDYWDRLTEWAIGEPEEARTRMSLVNDHRARIDRITEKMVLPRDCVG